jgi:hypothetical protein
MPGAAPVPPPVAPQPEIKLFIAVAGQQYGPYNMDMCKQMVQGGQLTPQSMVWMEGMPAWAPASQVPALQVLFAPPTPAMPPIPPTGGSTPPPMM